jgi:hypothetical protein
MSDEIDSTQAKNSPRYELLALAAVGGAALTAGLVHLVGWMAFSWTLLVVGVILLALAGFRLLATTSAGERLKSRVQATDPIVRLWASGLMLLAIGLVARFGPQDIGMALAVAGLLAAAAAATWFVNRPIAFASGSAPATSSGQPTSATADANGDAYARLSESFRHEVARVVFRHVQRASWMTFLVSLSYFIFGIGAFILIAYIIYCLQFAPSGSNRSFFEAVSFYISNQLSNQRGEPVDGLRILSNLLPMMAVVVGPVLGLFLIGWIGNKLIGNAMRMSQRRVIQETLGELGPLQAALAGLPPRKPMLQVVEQSLDNARSSFVVRTWLSVALFSLGAVCFVGLLIFGLGNGFNDWLTSATVGGTGIASFVFSMLGNRQAETRATLKEITELELTVARAAQRTEIVDRYFAEQVQAGIGTKSAQDMKALLQLLDEPATQTLVRPEVHGTSASAGVPTPAPGSAAPVDANGSVPTAAEPAGNGQSNSVS